MPLELLLFSTLYKDASLCSDTSTKQPRLRNLTDNEKARVKEDTYTKQMLISFKKKKEQIIRHKKQYAFVLSFA